MDLEGLQEAVLDMHGQIKALKDRVQFLEDNLVPKHNVKLSGQQIRPSDMLPGRYYRLEYRLRAARTRKFAQLEFLGMNLSSRYDFSGRPGIGTVSLFPDEILTVWEVPEGAAKATWFNKSQPVT